MKLLTRDRSDQHKRDARKIIEALENGGIPHGASEVAWYTAARYLMARIEYANARAQGWEDDLAGFAERTGAKYTALTEELDRLRRYITEARPAIEKHNPGLHAEIMADPMWQD